MGEHGTMGTNNLIFLENIEWFDESGQELVHLVWIYSQRFFHMPVYQYLVTE